MYGLHFCVWCFVLFCFIILYSYLFLSSYILHSCRCHFFFLNNVTSRPDFKEPFSVFVINQCFSCFDKWLPIKLFFLIIFSVTDSFLTDRYHLITDGDMFNYCCQFDLDNNVCSCCWLKCVLFVWYFWINVSHLNWRTNRLWGIWIKCIRHHCCL